MVGMSGGGDGGVSISSWGWANIDGDPVNDKHGQSETPVFRKWSVTIGAERVGMILAPVAEDVLDVFLRAVRAFGPEDD